MKRKYRFVELSRAEKEYHEMILLEEMDAQCWYVVSCSSLFNEELIVPIQ